MAWSRLVDRDLLFKCSAVNSHSHGSADFVMQEKAFGRTTDNMFQTSINIEIVVIQALPLE